MKGGAQGVNRFAKWVPGEQGGGLKYPRGFSGTHTVSQGLTGGAGWGASGSRGRPAGSQVVKREVNRVPGGQGGGLQGHRGSRGRLTGSQGATEGIYWVHYWAQ